MAGEEHYSVRILQSLETLLIGEGYREQADMLAAVAKRLQEGKDPEVVLRQLYSVKGWDKIALRLLWFEQKAREVEPRVLERSLKDLHILELHDAVLQTGAEAQGAVAPKPDGHPAPSQEFSDALVRFDAAVGVLKQRSLNGDEFVGIEQPLIEILQDETDALRTVATAEGNQDVVRFSTALSIFLVYVVDKTRLGDVRTMNIIDNANLTLQTVMQAMSAADYDSLQQTAQLLENPGTLME
jgi:hypothetical protein